MCLSDQTVFSFSSSIKNSIKEAPGINTSRDIVVKALHRPTQGCQSCSLPNLLITSSIGSFRYCHQRERYRNWHPAPSRQPLYNRSASGGLFSPAVMCYCHSAMAKPAENNLNICHSWMFCMAAYSPSKFQMFSYTLFTNLQHLLSHDWFYFGESLMYTYDPSSVGLFQVRHEL